jgi:hypothetical protein
MCTCAWHGLKLANVVTQGNKQEWSQLNHALQGYAPAGPLHVADSSMVSAYLCLLQKCMLTGGSGRQVRLLRGIPLLLLLRLLLVVVLLGEVAPGSVGCRVAPRQDGHRLGGALPHPPVPHGPPALVRPLLRRRLLLPRCAICGLVALRGCRWRCCLRPRGKYRCAADGAVLLPLQP